MAKYELIKETNALGDVIYYIEKDGSYVDGSIKLDLERAKEAYDNIVIHKAKKIKETIESVEV